MDKPDPERSVISRGTRRRLFLERRTYRRHRLQDAARLVPVFGALLFFGPVIILTSQSTAGAETSVWAVYFFTVWAGLIVLSAVLSRALSRIADGETEEKTQPPSKSGPSAGGR